MPQRAIKTKAEFFSLPKVCPLEGPSPKSCMSRHVEESFVEKTCWTTTLVREEDEEEEEEEEERSEWVNQQTSDVGDQKRQISSGLW